MGGIVRSAVPFLFLQLPGLAICTLFARAIIWLPRLVCGRSRGPPETAAGTRQAPMLGQAA